MTEEKANVTTLDDLFAKVDIKGKLADVLKDILNTDAREDQFRNVKVLLLYQALLLDDIAGKLDAIGSVLINQENALNSIGKIAGIIMSKQK